MRPAARIEDLSVEAIKAALFAEDGELSVRQEMAVRDFLLRIGGIQNALLALELLIDSENPLDW